MLAAGWGGILERTGRAVYEDDCLGWAAELAYFWFLALFPAILFVATLASYLPVDNPIDTLIAPLWRVVPADVLLIVREQLVQLGKGEPGGRLTLSLAAAVWSSSSGMAAIIGKLNQAYQVKEGRAW